MLLVHLPCSWIKEKREATVLVSMVARGRVVVHARGLVVVNVVFFCLFERRLYVLIVLGKLWLSKRDGVVDCTC